MFVESGIVCYSYCDPSNQSITELTSTPLTLPPHTISVHPVPPWRISHYLDLLQSGKDHTRKHVALNGKKKKKRLHQLRENRKSFLFREKDDVSDTSYLRVHHHQKPSFSQKGVMECR